MARGEGSARPVLARVLGPWDAVAMVVGSVIGSGIFFKPQVIAQSLPSVGLIALVWIVGGLLSLAGALTLAELAAMMPEAGGPYAYLRGSFGRMPAFLWGWTEFWVVRGASVAALATAFGLALARLTPLTALGLKAVACGIIAILALVNVIGTRQGGRMQDLTTIAKVGFVAALAIVPFVLGKDRVENFRPLLPAHLDGSLLGGFGAALVAVLWAYDGWVNIAPVAEEIREPQRNIPRALWLGMLILIALYLGATASYHGVLPMSRVQTSSPVAAAACRAMFGAVGERIVAVGIMASTFGAVNANLLAGPRVAFAMARDGVFPRPLARIHPRFQTPAMAIVIQAGWAIGLILIGDLGQKRPLYDILTDSVIFGGSVFYTLAIASIFVFRRRYPDWPRPYRAWGYPLVPALYIGGFAFVLVSMIVNTPIESGSGLGIIAAGAIYYLVVAARRSDGPG